MSGLSTSESGKPTPRRYALVNKVALEDWRPDSYPSTRFVAYNSSGSVALTEVRDGLIARGLILGHRNPTMSTAERQVYNVPSGARPLNLEASQPREGQLRYSDAAMAYDLGVLMARTSEVAGGRLFTSPAEQAFAIVDYVPAGEAHLYSIPGAEEWLGEEVPPEQRAQVQVDAFSTVFADRFARYTGEYQAGYIEGIGMERGEL